MAGFGYTLMTEQAGPRALVRHAREAERAGFDFEVMSDHYFPWLAEQGHSPNAWATLGAVTQSTERVELADSIPCGDDPDVVASSVKPFLDAGFTDVALVQIGGEHQDAFFSAATERILPALRALAG